MSHTLLALLLAGLSLAPAARAAAIVYDNTTNDRGTGLSYIGNGLVEAGDQIQLAGTNRYITQALVEIYNEGVNDANGATATLRLYSATGNVLGALLGTFTLAPANYVAGQTAQLVFDLPYVLVPDDIIWTMTFSSADLTLNYYFAPTLGLSGDGAWWNTGSGLTAVNPVGSVETYNARFLAEAAVPEPGTWVLLGAGLVVVAARRRR